MTDYYRKYGKLGSCHLGAGRYALNTGISGASYETVPLTGFIGRIFEKERGFQFFIYPTYDQKRREFNEKPHIVRLYENNNVLRIANVGCGACADVPLMEMECKRVLEKYGIGRPKVEIKNIDLWEEADNVVKSGEFKYNVVSPYTSSLDKQSSSYYTLEKYIDQVFEQVVDRQERYFKMKREFRENIDVQIGNATDLETMGIKDQDIILFHNVLTYLDEETRIKSINSFKRSLAEGGMLSVDFGFYEKSTEEVPKRFLRKGGKIERFHRKCGRDFNRYGANYNDEYALELPTFDEGNKNTLFSVERKKRDGYSGGYFWLNEEWITEI